MIDGAVTAEGDAIRLAWWIKNNYGATMISALKTVLPVKQKVKQVVKRTLHCLVDADRQSCTHVSLRRNIRRQRRG